ncbi:MAG: serine hydrolase [Bacteriovorax sp.]|jgi:CubicO group peptidase (beta-lactamase class C family)|nr:serine hydrolase [Bacteriovorax sp.]
MNLLSHLSLFFIGSLVSSTMALAATDMNSPECTAFTKVATGQRDDFKNGLQTDQIIVNRNGVNLYSWSDDTFTLDKLHPLWSSSVTIAATLVGAAIQKGDLKIDSRLKEFFPQKLADPIQQFYYDQITIDHLLAMSSGLMWDESHKDDSKDSTIMKMLYGKDQMDMNQFVLSQVVEMMPGFKWNYNGGNAVVLMAILKKIYGNDQFADDLLFKPLKIKNAFFEKDASGNAIAAMYSYMTPADMIKIGLLYLENGSYQGVQILPKAWVKKAQSPSSALSRSDTKTDPVNVASLGVYSQRGFWLNQDLPSLKIEHEFKNSPTDMFFAAGNNGQLMIVLPTQKIVIALTGHSLEYWSKIDKLVSNAVACFSTGALLAPLEDVPSPAIQKDDAKNFKLGTGVLAKGYLQAYVAKEVCSCHYVSQLSFEQCIERLNVPVRTNQLERILDIELDDNVQLLKVKPSLLGKSLSFGKAKSKEASFLGMGLGCRLNPAL